MAGISFGTGVFGAAVEDMAELEEIWPPPVADTPIGVYGYSKGSIGVKARSKSGTALRVDGRSSFSTVGSGTIPRGHKSFAVDVEPGVVTENSHVSVTLTSDPNVIGRDAAVSFIERDPANDGFVIN